MNTTRTLLSVTLALAMGGAITGCHHEQTERAEMKADPVHAHLATVEKVVEGKPIEVYGIVQPARQSFVSSRVMGPVIAVRVAAGDVVKKGQILLSIKPQTIEGQVSQAEGALAQAQAALALAEKNFHRYERLHEKRAASDLELDMARMQYEQAQGAVQQAQGAVKSASSVADEATVKAPYPARVVDKLVEVGDLAAPGRPLVRLESLDSRSIWLTVREADIRRVQEGASLSVRFDTRPELGQVSGTVNEIVAAADPATHTFTVKASLGDLHIPSGISGRATLPGDEVERLVIPAVAVHRRGGLELVVVRDADGTARTRAVTTGSALAGGRIEVLSGLAEGEQVAIDLPAPVADGTPVEVAS